MYNPTHRRAANSYALVQNNSNMGEESPHRLIQMLMEGFLARVNSAKAPLLMVIWKRKPVISTTL